MVPHYRDKMLEEPVVVRCVLLAGSVGGELEVLHRVYADKTLDFAGSVEDALDNWIDFAKVGGAACSLLVKT